MEGHEEFEAVVVQWKTADWVGLDDLGLMEIIIGFADFCDGLGRKPQHGVGIRLDQFDDRFTGPFSPGLRGIEGLLRGVKVFEVVVGTHQKIGVWVMD
jgi:hypothetical protein